MDFYILKYLLLSFVFVAGTYFYKRDRVSNQKYWVCVLPIIFLYSFMEGCRWNRGADYMSYYNLALGRVQTGDVFFDGLADSLRSLGCPFYIFFIVISFILIVSLLRFVRDFKPAFLPCFILLYLFSMGQSENIVRQWCAESFMLLGFCSFFDKKILPTLFYFTLGYLTHKSIIFILPFFLLSYCLYQWFSALKTSIWVPIVFLILLLLSSTLKQHLEGFFQVLNFSFGFTEESGFSDDRLSKIFDAEDVIESSTQSSIYWIRIYLRYLIVIILGFFVAKDGPFKRKDLFLHVAYALACIGIIYRSILPPMHTEFLWRAGLYLEVFLYFMEGLIFYAFLMRNRSIINFPNSLFPFAKGLLYILLVLELILVFKPYDHDMLFIWNRF